MCFVCNGSIPAKITSDAALHAIATSHRNILSRQLAESPVTAAALFGEIPADGCDLLMDIKRDSQTRVQTLTARTPDGDKELRITYAHEDLNASVAYTGNGPEGQSHIGVDAIDTALDYICSKANGLEVLTGMGIEFGHGAMRTELELTQLVKRCLVALREHAVKDSATE